MARLITKFKYLKPNARKSVGGYAKYIATREGVDKIDASYKLEPSSKKQRHLIEKILRDFPDSKEMLEYEDYQNEPTVGNASEFITRALEDNACEVMQTKTYADYIATRPRAQRFGTHGLFILQFQPYLSQTQSHSSSYRLQFHRSLPSSLPDCESWLFLRIRHLLLQEGTRSHLLRRKYRPSR